MSFKDPVVEVTGLLQKFENSNDSLERRNENFKNLVNFFKSPNGCENLSLEVYITSEYWRFILAFKTVFEVRKEIENNDKVGVKIVQNMLMCLGFLVRNEQNCKELKEDDFSDIFALIFSFGSVNKNIMALSVWVLGCQRFPDEECEWSRYKGKIHSFLQNAFKCGEGKYQSSCLIFETLSTLYRLIEKTDLEFDKFASHWLSHVLKYAVFLEPPLEVKPPQVDHFPKSHKIALKILQKVYKERESLLPNGLIPRILCQKKDRGVVHQGSLNDCQKGVNIFNKNNQPLFTSKGLYDHNKFNDLSVEYQLGKLRYLFISVLCLTFEHLTKTGLKKNITKYISRIVITVCKHESEETTEIRKFCYRLLELCIHKFCMQHHHNIESLKKSEELRYYFKALFCFDQRPKMSKGYRFYVKEKSDEARTQLLGIWYKMMGQIWNKGFDRELYNIYMKMMINNIWKFEKTDGNFITSITFLSNFVLFQDNERFIRNTGRREGIKFVENCRNFEAPLYDIRSFLHGMICDRKKLFVGEQSLLFDSLCKRVIKNYRNAVATEEEKKDLKRLTIQMIISICDLVKQVQELYFFGVASSTSDSPVLDDEEKMKVVSWSALRQLLVSMTKSVLEAFPFHYPKRERSDGEDKEKYEKLSPDVFEMLVLPWLPKIKNREESLLLLEEEEEEEEDEGEGDVVMKKRNSSSSSSRRTGVRRFRTKEEEDKDFGVFYTLHELVLSKFNDSKAKHIKLYIKMFLRHAMLSTQGLKGKNDSKTRIPLISHTTFVKVWRCTVDILTKAIPAGQSIRPGQVETNYYQILFLPMVRYSILANGRISILRKIVDIRKLGPRNQRTESQKKEMGILKKEYENYLPEIPSIQRILEKWKILLDRQDKVIGYSTLFPKLHREVLTVNTNRDPVIAANPVEEGRIYNHLGNFLIRLGVTLFEVLGSSHFLSVVEYNIQFSRYLIDRNCSDLLKELLFQIRTTIIHSDVEDPKKRKASETLEGYTKLFGFLFSILDMDKRVIPNGYPYDLSNVWKTVLDGVFGAVLEKKLYDGNGFLWKVSPLFTVTLGTLLNKGGSNRTTKIHPSPMVDIEHQIETSKCLMGEYSKSFWNEKLGPSSQRLEFPGDLKEIVEKLNKVDDLYFPSGNVPKLKISDTQRKNEEEEGDGMTDGDLDPLPGRKRRRPRPVVDGNKKLRNRKEKKKVDKDGYAIIEEEEEEEGGGGAGTGGSDELISPTLDGSLAVKKKEELAMRPRKRRRVMVDEMNDSIMPHNTITDFGTLADINKYGELISPSKKKKKKKEKNKMKDEDEEEEEVEEVEMNPPTQIINPINLDLGSSVTSSGSETTVLGDIPDRDDVDRLKAYMFGAAGILRNITSEQGKAEAREILEGYLKQLL